MILSTFKENPGSYDQHLPKHTQTLKCTHKKKMYREQSFVDIFCNASDVLYSYLHCSVKKVEVRA